MTMNEGVNVTLLASRNLVPALEGRDRIELGVPQSATLVDVLETLFTLYPKLGRFLASERRPLRSALQLMVDERSGQALLSGGRLREGDRLYLSAPAPRVRVEG
jgi:hypothetical protein